MAGDNLSSHAPHRGGRTADSGHSDLRSGAVSNAAVAALDSDIRLTLPARPENVAVVRHVLGALAEALGLPVAVTDDMRLAVTEACTNVVRHAYGDADGTIDVVVRPKGDALQVIVADTGRGLGPSPDTAGPGLGLPLIAALTDSLEIERGRSTGSRLVMWFMRTRTTPAMGFA
jgi:anti-sigma regulatory factor (Ser/Thr protein kinase)